MRPGGIFATLAILIALITWTQPANAQPYRSGEEEYSYLIFRNGKELGKQHVAITRKDQTAIATIRIEMAYRLGFIKLYDYRHESREEWHAGNLRSLDSRTTENGETRFLRVVRDQDTLAIDGSAGKYASKKSAFPTTYWQIGLLEHQTLFNTEDGTPVHVTTEKLGDARLMLDGREIRARHFRISGDLNIELWYSAEGTWLQSRFFIDDAEIIFQLQSLST
ncbi:MAG TPA: hypothetical protein DCZ06_11195 [Alphaproteobacteria bacterium]|nr:hypothetical protein [Alphaproteobacteria bacterium]